MRAIDTPDLRKAALERLKAQGLSGDSVERLGRWLAGDDRAIAALPAMRGAFARDRRGGAIAIRGRALALRLVDALARQRGWANKRRVGPAPTLAVLGVDGAGKSRLCRALVDRMAVKVSATRIYLGSNADTYRPLTRLAWWAHGGPRAPREAKAGSSAARRSARARLGRSRMVQMSRSSAGLAARGDASQLPAWS